MKGSFIFDKTYQILGHALNITSRRNALISGNIANVDTIGYQPRDIDFQKALKKAVQEGGDGELRQTHPKHLPRHDPSAGFPEEVRAGAAGEFQPDSVDIDTEMTNLLENNITYRTSIEMLLRKIGMVRQSITEGGR